MSSANAVVDGGLSCALRIPTINISSADLELKRGSHSVHYFISVVLFVLPVLVKVNEPGRNDKPPGIDCGATLELTAADGFNGSVGNAEVAHDVEVRFRVNYSPIQNNDVVEFLRAGMNYYKRKNGEGN